MAEIQPTRIVENISYYNMTQGAIYMGLTTLGFRKRIIRLGVQRYEFPGAREKFVRKDDLDALLLPQPVQDRQKLQEARVVE